MRLCCVECCLHYAPLFSRDLENSFLKKDKERKLKELEAMAINAIWKILTKQKIREIPIFVNPAENPVSKTSYESRLPSRLYEDPNFPAAS